MFFISYRKEDTQAVVDLLAEKLKDRFGDKAVFKDDRDIRAGEQWPDRLRDELRARCVLLAVIGDKWLTASDKYGRRRIDDEQDWVRQEICTAMELGKRVIVILVNNASMPTEEGLPPDCLLRNLPKIQYSRLRSGSDSEADVRKIIEELARFCPADKSTSTPPSFRYRVVAFDLDGTLVRGDKPFSWKRI